MNELFYEKNSDAHIIDENKNIRIIPLKDNMEEILVIENNVEEIENLIRVSNKNATQNFERIKGAIIKNIILVSLIIFFAASLSIFSFEVLGFSIKSLGAVLTTLFFSTIGGDSIIQGFKEMKNAREAHEKDIFMFSESLKKEQEKLKELKSKSKEKKTKLSEPKIVPRSAIIKNLEQKSYLIYCYIKHRKDWVNLYNDGILEGRLSLDSHLYGSGAYEFIKVLIEQDLKNGQLKKSERGKIKVKN